MNDFCWTQLYVVTQKLAAATIRDHLMDILRKHRLALDETVKALTACEIMGQDSEDSFEDKFGPECPSERKNRIRAMQIFHEAVIAEASFVLRSCCGVESISE